MQAEPLPVTYVAVLPLPDGSRLFCSDQYRDEWSARIGYAETFRALHEALGVALRHGGLAMPWREAQQWAS